MTTNELQQPSMVAGKRSYGKCRITSGASGAGNGAVNYTVDSNVSNCVSRTGTLTIAGKTFTATQAGGSGSGSIAPTSGSVAATADAGSFTVTAGSGCSWTASSDASWLHTSSGGTGNGPVSYTYDANTSNSSRTGHITARGQTFTLTQAGGSCTYSLNPTSTSVGSSFSSGNISVTVISGCSWLASPSDSWIHTTSSGSGNGTVSYTVDANSSTNTRIGTITVQGQIFTITQAAPPLATISVQDNLSNGGTVSGAGTYPVGQSVQIAAIANSGWTFTGWNDSNIQNPRTITVPSGGGTYTANFQQQTAVVTLRANPNSAGTVSGGGVYPVGSSQQIMASAKSGWMFTGWNDGNTQNPHTITVSSGGATYTANFIQQQQTVATPTITPATGGTFSNSVTVTLRCTTAGATIRYTINGSDPTTTSPIYNKTALTLTNSVTLKAAAFKAKMAESVVATATFTIIPPPPLTITTTSLTDGVIKVKYTAGTMQATGGVPSYKWSLASGKLPAGMTLNATTGVIAGKPTKSGTFFFNVKVTDAKKHIDTQALSLTVN